MTDTESARTPREVVLEVLRRASTGDFVGTMELYVEDIDLDFPFRLPAPLRIHGREHHVSNNLNHGISLQSEPPRLYHDLEVGDVIVHETADPHIVVMEWTYTSRIGDSVVVNRNIMVTECRDGKVVKSRDYHNFVSRAQADGTLPEMLKIIEQMILPEDR